MTRDNIRFQLEHFIEWPTDDRSTISTTSAVLFAEAMARDVAKTERARCIRTIQRMPVPIDQVEGARRAIAAIEALKTETTS
jgi:hypothetical protein